ncbi:STE/STE20/MST protein kinase [Allomyces macrogynus ATCC 38327]|uniref:non-specific serine/threonine protein kinase n=1 Tax=Allomyces macrogynus (strain ATCC 38327) TaxID=578462 RepID=A0A0L0T5G5_ALLM3|nr:STE/STE20/MST protein kinase [Allomyces macrogynus ATCC 38327]|eukprot:KNE69970.1 STE/STE20/MST protein kinase [Allomyces macrogynus ATCC 38327]
MSAALPLTPEEHAGTLEDAFSVDEKIGQGSYGSVFRGTHKRTGAVVALKKVPIDGDLDSLMHEITVLQACDSPAIIALHAFYVEPPALWIVMELCPAGSVADIVRATGVKLTEPHIASIAHDALVGLAYLHRHGRLHRDVKAGNVLVTAEGHCKLADFGVAGQLTDAAAKRNTVIGTPYWMAPEVIQEVGYTTKADIWSLGITMLELADGHPPFHNIHPMRAIFMIPTRPPPRLANETQWSPLFRAFVARCLTKNPDLRPTAADLLADEFITQPTDPALMPTLAGAAIAAMAARRAKGLLGAVPHDDIGSDSEEDETVAETARGPLDVTLKPRTPRHVGASKARIVSEAITVDDDEEDALVEATGTMIIRESTSSEAPTFPLDDGTMKRVDFDDATIKRIDFDEATVKRIDFDDATVKRTDFDDATMRRTDYVDTDDATVKLRPGFTSTGLAAADPGLASQPDLRPNLPPAPPRSPVGPPADLSRAPFAMAPPPRRAPPLLPWPPGPYPLVTSASQTSLHTTSAAATDPFPPRRVYRQPSRDDMPRTPTRAPSPGAPLVRHASRDTPPLTPTRSSSRRPSREEPSPPARSNSARVLAPGPGVAAGRYLYTHRGAAAGSSPALAAYGGSAPILAAPAPAPDDRNLLVFDRRGDSLRNLHAHHAHRTAALPPPPAPPQVPPRSGLRKSPSAGALGTPVPLPSWGPPPPLPPRSATPVGEDGPAFPPPRARSLSRDRGRAAAAGRQQQPQAGYPYAPYQP